MKILILALVALAASEVVVLTDSDFNQVEEGTWLVKFYTPWCGHCKRLAPVWDELSEKTSDFKVAKVDCTVEKQSCKDHGVSGYPTLKLFHKGNTIAYSGQRTLESFIEFVAKNTGAPAVETTTTTEESAGEVQKEGDLFILTDKTFDEQTKTGDWFVKFYAPWCGHCKRLAPTWDELATQGKEQFSVAKVDCTVEKETCTKHEVRGYPTLKLLMNGDAQVYKGAREINDFMNFYKEQKQS